jgi:CelD/BcsL family acetyltransferase involved in cellulose biosynthesis
VNIDTATPWEAPEWDAYVAGHPAGNVYHTSAWIRTVCDVGGYEPVCLVARAGDGVSGMLPAVAIRSRLTGNRLTSLPFTDKCGVLADDADTATQLLASALERRDALRLDFHEMRAAPAIRSGEALVPGDAYAEQLHFQNFVVPLEADSDAVRMTFSRKSVRQTINKSGRLGVTVRTGHTADDLAVFYRLYALNRRRHGIPPQPLSLFKTAFERFRGEPGALLYIAEHGTEPLSALVVFRYKGVAYAKYEGVDEARRDLLSVYPLFWESIRDACEAGDHAYDFGRTAEDNRGLMEFKGRWGTEQIPLPYYFSPPREGLSVVRSDSLKYRIFTGAFRRMPLGVTTWLGARIFRHFG